MIRIACAAALIVMLSGCVGVKDFYVEHRDVLATAVKVRLDGKAHDECIDEVIKAIEEELGVVEESE